MSEVLTREQPRNPIALAQHLMHAGRKRAISASRALNLANSGRPKGYSVKNMSHSQASCARPPCHACVDGHWALDNSSAGAAQHVAQAAGLRAQAHFEWLSVCDDRWSRQSRTGTRPRWEWQCSSRHSATQDAFRRLPRTVAERCAALTSRPAPHPVLFIGDSLSRLHALTLASLLEARPCAADGACMTSPALAAFWSLMPTDAATDAANRTPAFLGMGAVDVWSTCAGRVIVQFVRSDWLLTRTDFATLDRTTAPLASNGFPCNAPLRSLDERVPARCMPWASEAFLRHFGVLFLNSGAHAQPSEADYATTLAAAAAFVKRHAPPSARLIYRTTVPGHLNCERYKFAPPLPTVHAAEMEANRSGYWYDGATFAKRNRVAVDIFTRGNGSFALLDAYRTTIQRRDSHISHLDCLHYCLPGPADHWANMLFELL